MLLSAVPGFSGYSTSSNVRSKGEDRKHIILVFSTGEPDIDYDFSTTGVLDLIGGCILLLPALGLLSGGAWELDKSHVQLQLQ